MPFGGAGGAGGADGEVLLGAADGALGEAGGVVGGLDLAEGLGPGGELAAEEDEGAVELGGDGERLGRRAEVEAVVVDVETEGSGDPGEVVFDDREATVGGLEGIGGVDSPDEAGDLGDGAGTEEVVEGNSAGATLAGLFAQVVGEQKGLAGDAGQIGDGFEQVLDGPAVPAGPAEPAQAIEDDEADFRAAGEDEEGLDVIPVVDLEVAQGALERAENALEVEVPGAGALEVEGVAGFAFAPDDVPGRAGEGGAVGPGGTVEVGGGEVEAEKGFAGAGLAGENGEEAAGQPAGPVPADGGEVTVDAAPSNGG